MQKISSLLVSFITLMLFSSILSAESQGLDAVTLQLKWKPSFQFAGYYAALEHGFYEEVGLDVTIRPLSGELDVVDKVVSGDVDYAIGGSGLLAHYANGAPIKALAAIFQHDALVFVSKDSSGIISPYEMKGKRIMFDGTSGNDGPLIAMLADANLSQDDYIRVAPTFRSDELINDQVDVVSVYITDQPFKLTQQQIKFNIIKPQNYGFDFYGDILYTSQTEIDQHRGRAEQFRQASLKGWQYALDHPEELIQLLKNKYNSEASVESLRYEAKETRKLILPDVIPLGTIKPNRLRRVADTYTELKIANRLDDVALSHFIFNSSLQKFTAEESAWLASHPVIRVGVDRDFAPYEWVDEHGEYQGIAADYIHLLEDKLGVRFEIIGDKSWNEIREMAQRGELDMLSCVNETPERKSFLNFTASYISNPIVIINANRNAYIGSLDNLSGKTVAIERGYFTHENLAEYYPKIKLLVVDSTREALEKVAVGEADAYVGDAAYANYAMKQAEILSLQFSGQTNDTAAYRIGIHKSQPELVSIINKSLRSVTEEEKKTIESDWIGLNIQTGVSFENIVKTGIFTLLLLFAFIYRGARIRNYKETEHQRQAQILEQQATLLKLAKNNFSNLQLAFNKVVKVDAELLNIDRVSIWLLNQDHTALHCKSLYHGGRVSNEKVILEAKDYPDYFDALNSIGFISASDANHHPSTHEFSENYLEPLGITSMLDTPIHVRGEIIGIVCHEHIGPKREWGVEEEFARSIADVCAQIIIEIERTKAENKLDLMAHYDVLTQLPNRALFADRFKQAIAHSKRTESMVAICFLDLDNFKPVNDNYGHDMGDKLLIEVAHRIKESIREEDTVSRQGGDEFALLLRDIDSFSKCEKTAERIRDSIAKPIVIEGISHQISVSIGTTIYPLDDADLDILIRHADQAMYQSKLIGKDQHQFFNALHDKQTIDDQTRLQEITQAFSNQEFQLYYQPKVNMKTGAVLGAEALIRWLHPEKGIIPPLDFLPNIEGTDLEIQLGGWVIHEALSQMDTWQQLGIKLQVSINVSSHHLQDLEFFDQLSEALALYPDVDSQDLQLEILESSALGDLKAIRGVIKSCQNLLGVSVALDDFGTGYSSLTHMRSLPANTIKIDQTFVRDVLHDPNDYSIIEGVIGLAKAFKRDVIAEGVETNAHGLMLLVMGCNEAQGYQIARPMPADDIPLWLTNYVANIDWMNYGEVNHTVRQQKITLLQLTTEYWLNNVSNEILSEVDSGLGLYVVKCHLGVWLAHYEEKGLFEQSWLEELYQLDDEFYELACELVNKHQTGDIEGAREGLDELNTIHQQVQKELAQGL